MTFRTQLLVVALGGFVAATAQAQQTPHQSRLEAIQGALVDTALLAPTRVRATAWVDESGTLRENAHITSDVKVRGVRVSSYLEPELAPETKVVVDAVTPLVRADGCTPAAPRYKRVALVHTLLQPGGAGGQPNLGDLALQAQQAVLDEFTAAAAWSVRPAMRFDSEYERRLMGQPQDPQLALVLTIAAAPPVSEPVRDVWQAWGFKPVANIRRTRATLQLVDRQAGRVVWEQQTLLDYPGAVGNVTTLPLPTGMAETLRALATQWRAALDRELSCEPVQFRVTGGEAGYYALDVGTRSGLRVGDQILIYDAARIPGNVLETASAGLAALGVVERVATDQAVVRRVAGPTLATPATLVALPL